MRIRATTHGTRRCASILRARFPTARSYLTRALIAPMVKNRYGRILFFVGDGAISARGSGRAHLSAAKMGLIGMARGLASEFADDGEEIRNHRSALWKAHDMRRLRREAGRLIERKELSPIELIGSRIDRITRLDGS